MEFKKSITENIWDKNSHLHLKILHKKSTIVACNISILSCMNSKTKSYKAWRNITSLHSNSVLLSTSLDILKPRTQQQYPNTWQYAPWIPIHQSNAKPILTLERIERHDLKRESADFLISVDTSSTSSPSMHVKDADQHTGHETATEQSK